MSAAYRIQRGLALPLAARMGARVHGFALDPHTRPSFFEVCNIALLLKNHTIGDKREADAVARALKAAEPEIVLHLAAQALVREPYLSPAETYQTNVMGTVNLLAAVRQSGGVRALVNVTTQPGISDPSKPTHSP